MNDKFYSCPICGCIDEPAIVEGNINLFFICPCCGDTISLLDFYEGALNSYT